MHMLSEEMKKSRELLLLTPPAVSFFSFSSLVLMGPRDGQRGQRISTSRTSRERGAEAKTDDA